MEDAIRKYGIFIGLLVIVALAYLAKRAGGGGAASGPAYSNITEGIDTNYEALKLNAEVQKAAIAAGAYQTLTDYETAQTKFSTDVTLANIEGGYAVEMKRQDVALGEYQANTARDISGFQTSAARDIAQFSTAAQERIAASESSARVQQTNATANADIKKAQAAASAEKHKSFWGSIGGIVSSILGFL